MALPHNEGCSCSNAQHVINLPTCCAGQNLKDPAAKLLSFAGSGMKLVRVAALVWPARVMQSLEMRPENAKVACLNEPNSSIDEGGFAVAIVMALPFVLSLEILIFGVMRVRDVLGCRAMAMAVCFSGGLESTR